MSTAAAATVPARHLATCNKKMQLCFSDSACSNRYLEYITVAITILTGVINQVVALAG